MNKTWQLIKLKMAGRYVRFKQSRCQWCGEEEDLDVHHAVLSRKMIIEKWKAGLISYDTALFLINDSEHDYLTLCRRCHITIGHFGNWETLNEKATIVCATYGKKEA